MINLYEGSLRLSKAKLYQSPYKETIDKVWEILKTFKIKSRLNFLRNLRTLEIEFVNDTDVDKVDYLAMATYHNNINKIYLKKDFSDEVLKVNLSHELFHAASNRRKAVSTGIIRVDYIGKLGENLNEGITEYLGLKSMNKRVSSSGYQLELFVIEFLIFIYGEEILKPYFDGNGKAFFYQFQQFGISSDIILKLDKYLRNISDNEMFQSTRLVFLYLADLFPDVLKYNIKDLKELKLDLKTYIFLNQRMLDYKKLIIDVTEEEFLKYEYRDLDKKIIFDEYTLEFKKIQREKFEKILTTLMEMGELQNISFENISNFIQESLFYKDDSFKEMYTSVIYEKIGFQEKRGDHNEKNIGTTK